MSKVFFLFLIKGHLVSGEWYRSVILTLGYVKSSRGYRKGYNFNIILDLGVPKGGVGGMFDSSFLLF